MKILSAKVLEIEFTKFLEEILYVSDKYVKEILECKNFIPINKNHIELILRSKNLKKIFKNIEKNKCEIFIYIGNELVYNTIADIGVEIIVASLYMGTALFRDNYKLSVSDIDFLNKKITEIQFIKIDDYWILDIDVV